MEDASTPPRGTLVFDNLIRDARPLHLTSNTRMGTETGTGSEGWEQEREKNGDGKRHDMGEGRKSLGTYL